MRSVARRTAKGDVDQLLYGLARQAGLEQANETRDLRACLESQTNGLLERL